jgi:hypothetical protein
MDSLSIFTVYENPRDYPGRFVVRRFEVSADTVQPDALAVVIANTLDQARAAIRREHPGAIRLPRADGDEPQIVESWI